MKEMKTSSLFVLGFLFYSPLVLAKENCSFDHHLQSGNLTTQETPMGGSCNLFLAPSDTGNAYRSFLFKSDGMIQVGDKYNIPGKDFLNTATHVFYVFPRTNGHPSADIVSLQNPNSRKKDIIQMIQVSLPSGDGILFSTGKQRTASSPRALPLVAGGEAGLEVIENPTVSPANKGGVTIKPGADSQTIVLDAGYSLGNKPAILNPKGTSFFKDSGDVSCPVPNSAIFKVTGPHDAELLMSDARLFSYLRAHCPKGFQVPGSPVQTGPARGDGTSNSNSATQP
jgi:hypothetical protein